jgi:hypothetical protein
MLRAAVGVRERPGRAERCLAIATARGAVMASKYSRKASTKVKQALHERKEGTLRSGGSGKKVTSRKQAIAIGLSEARRAGAKVPKKRATRKKAARKKS